MNNFRDDPYWQGYWRNNMQSRKILLYSLVPLLEVTGVLLRSAGMLWHPWSLRRIAELRQCAGKLSNHVDHMRGNGIGWSGNDSSSILGMYKPYRYRSVGEVSSPHPEAATVLATTATQLLFLLLPVAQKLKETHYEEAGLLALTSDMLETLVESPYFDRVREVPDVELRTLIECGSLLECEGIAHAMAKIEDAFTRREKRVKRKPSVLSDDELRVLANEIDIPFEELKDVFEHEHSSWWDKAKSYQERAGMARDRFIGMLRAPDDVKAVIHRIWEPGMATTHGSDIYADGERYKDSEQVANTLIALFLSRARESGNEVFVAQGRLSGENQKLS